MDKDFCRNYFSQAAAISSSLGQNPKITEAIALLKQVQTNMGRLFIVGSGGGAGHASHATCDFRKLAGIEAYCPTDNISELTARINDDGWATSLSNYLKGSHIGPGDLLLVLSVGGGCTQRGVSVNLVEAIRTAKASGAKVLSIVGRSDGYAGKESDITIVVSPADPSLLTPITESLQALVWHYFVSHPDLQVQTAKWETELGETASQPTSAHSSTQSWYHQD